MKASFLHRFFCASLVATLVFVAGYYPPLHGQSSTATPAPPTKETQAAMTPDSALAELKAGNVRFVAGQPAQRDHRVDVKTSIALGLLAYLRYFHTIVATTAIQRDSRGAAKHKSGG